MNTDKKDLVKQVNWALRLREPLCCGEVIILMVNEKQAQCALDTMRRKVI